MYKKSRWDKFKAKVSQTWSNIKRWFAKVSFKINEKGSQRLTIMIVPHSEKKIVNLQISNYILFFTSIIVAITLCTSVLAISRSQQTDNQFSQLKVQFKEKTDEIAEFKRSIQSVNRRFTMFKSDFVNVMKNVGEDEDVDIRSIYDVKDINLPDANSNNNRPREIAELEKLKLELDVTKENIRRMGEFMNEHRDLIRSMPSRYPLAAMARVTSRYGLRIDPVYKWKSESHPGLDMSVLPGTPVLATADGVVALAGWHGGYGILVELKHKYGFSTRYGHMMRLGDGIVPGVKVIQGQTIGYVGTTGKSTGYHLHYEVRVGGATTDPEPFISIIQ